MTKDEKIALVQQVTERLQETPNVYIADAGGMTVEEVSKLRGLCFDAGISMQVVKNTLLKKAFEAADADYSELYPVLKQQSSVFFVGENVNAPAKVLNKYRKDGNKEVPTLKGAWVGEAVFIGDESLKTLSELKSKDELIGEIVTLLQSPMKNVLGALQSGGNTIAGLVKALQEREG